MFQGHKRRDIFGIMVEKKKDTQALHMDFSTSVALLVKEFNLTEICECLPLSNFIYLDKTKNITYRIVCKS